MEGPAAGDGGGGGDVEGGGNATTADGIRVETGVKTVSEALIVTGAGASATTAHWLMLTRTPAASVRPIESVVGAEGSLLAEEPDTGPEGEVGGERGGGIEAKGMDGDGVKEGEEEAVEG